MINDLWYKNAVLYCLSVGTYMDANGDGIGDFQGLMRRLDYLHGLGVTAIWLMPFQTSPQRDDGYDVSDYYNVDPRYGDEIGMGEDLSLPERNCARTPMQWSNEPHGGFTKNAQPAVPVLSGGPYGFEHINLDYLLRRSEIDQGEQVP